MRVLLCSSPAGLYGTAGLLAAILQPHLVAAGADVSLITKPPTEPIDVDWWLVLDYHANLGAWLAANRGRARIAYTEGPAGDCGEDLSLPWRQGMSGALAPFCFLPESQRGGAREKAGVLVDHPWPGFYECGLDVTTRVVQALDPLPGVKIAFTHLAASTPADPSAGWTILPRLHREVFIALLARSTAFIQTHEECCSAVFREAVFLGCTVYAYTRFQSAAALTMEGVVPYDDPQDLPGLLMEHRQSIVSSVNGVETAAAEIVARLMAWRK